MRRRVRLMDMGVLPETVRRVCLYLLGCYDESRRTRRGAAIRPGGLPGRLGRVRNSCLRTVRAEAHRLATTESVLPIVNDRLLLPRLGTFRGGQ